MADERNEANEAGEGSERRRHPRHSQPRLVLRIEERKYRTRDWSLGGFRIDGFHRSVYSEEELEGVVTTWTGLFRESFNADVVHTYKQTMAEVEEGVELELLFRPSDILDEQHPP